MAAATDGFKPSDIAHSLKSKAEHAFGIAVTDPFAVKEIENHRADITYTVTASYTSEPVSRQVQYAAGPSCSREYIGEGMAQRHEQIFSDATYTRDLMQGHLKGNAELYREPVTKHLILSDDSYCYTVEDCRGCNGRGKNDCSTCNGTMYHTCRQCNGHPRMHCTNCSGTGNTSHSRHCTRCGGSGARMGDRFTLPLPAPRLWNWNTGSFLKALILAVPSMAVVQMFMALHPSQFVPLQFSSLIPTVPLNMGQVFAWFVVITPQIYLLSLTIAIIRYKAAGIHWGENMMRLMLQVENTTGIRRAFLEKS